MPPFPRPHDLDAAFDPLDAIDTIGQMLLASHFDPEALLQAITDVTVRKMGVKGCVLRMLHPETGELAIRSVTGLSERFLFSAPVIDGRNRFQSLLRQRGVYRLIDVKKGRDLQFSVAALEEGIVSLLAVGLFREKRVIGSLSIYTATPVRFTQAHIQTLRVLARYAVMALELARLYRQELQSKLLSRDLSIAAGIQKRMLQPALPSAEGIDAAVRMEPWYEVGGDYYDVTLVDEGLLSLAIGDVAGKGMPAALLMSSALMAFRSQMGVSRSLPDVVRSVNELFARISRPEEHATLFCGRLDLQERVLCYVNAGHPPPLVFRGGRVIPLETGGMPLGIRTPLAYTQGIRQLEEGDLLLLRTDGCTSACDEPGRVFGERRFRAAVKAHSSGSAARLVDEIMTSIRRFAGEAGQRDDQTVIALRIS